MVNFLLGFGAALLVICILAWLLMGRIQRAQKLDEKRHREFINRPWR
jgi:flagellar biogenesis protein FliO